MDVFAPHNFDAATRTARWNTVLTARKGGESPLPHGRLSRKLRLYYQQMRKDQAVVEESKIRSTDGGRDSDEDPTAKEGRTRMRLSLSVDAAARLTLAANFFLFFLKLAAAIQSNSLSVISSVIDSGLDLFSGVVIALTSYYMQHYDPHRYPIGRNRLEPVAIIITASVMGTAALQIVTSAINDLVSGSIDPNINGFSGAIVAFTVVLKGILFLVCYRVKNASVRALAVDHRNDVMSNIAALLFGLLGTYVLNILDPIGAIVLAIYIIVNWILVGREHLRNLVGHTADRGFISKVISMAINHDDRIRYVDTVRAYTFGINYLVEVDIVLSPGMLLQESHDIGESLQQRLEKIAEVERAFVHCDFEYDHVPAEEHVRPHH